MSDERDPRDPHADTESSDAAVPSQTSGKAHGGDTPAEQTASPTSGESSESAAADAAGDDRDVAAVGAPDSGAVGELADTQNAEAPREPAAAQTSRGAAEPGVADTDGGEVAAAVTAGAPDSGADGELAEAQTAGAPEEHEASPMSGEASASGAVDAQGADARAAEGGDEHAASPTAGEAAEPGAADAHGADVVAAAGGKPTEAPAARTKADTGDAPAARAPRSRRGWARVGTGAVLSLLVVGGVVGAAAADWPTVGGEAASVVISPDAAPNIVSCDGPVLALGRDATAADQITVAADAEVTVGATGDQEPEGSELDAVDLPEEAAAERYELGSADDGSLAAAESSEIRTEDMAGFAASACSPASMQSWVVGGSTALGATDILLLANPGPVNATAQLSVYGTDGVMPEADPIAIPAMSQIAVPLAGVAAGEAAPVVRVTAEGAPVRASLQSTEVRILDPVGIDSQGAVEPADRQVFPGVLVSERAAENDVTPATVRVLSRETGPVTVTVTAEGERDAAETLTLDAQADVPLEAALEGLEAGRYSIVVEGEAGPTVAAVRQTAGPAKQQDFAWQTPSPEVTGSVAVAVPAGPLANVYLVNDGEESTTVTLTGEDLDEEFALAPGEAHHVRVAADALYELATEGGPVRAAVAYRDGGSLASVPIAPDPAASADVTVYP